MIFFWQFFFKIMKWWGFHKIGAEAESRNSGDHELWNHEMRGSPLLPINVLGKSMSTKGTKQFPKFYLHFTYKYQQCAATATNQTQFSVQRPPPSSQLGARDLFLPRFSWFARAFMFKIEIHRPKTISIWVKSYFTVVCISTRPRPHFTT